MAAEVFEFPTVAEHAKNIVSEIVERNISSLKSINFNKANDVVDSLNATVVNKLREMYPNFKFIVNTLVSQNNMTALHYDSNAYWDPTTDCSFTVKVVNDNIVCISTVFGLAI